MVLGSVLLLLTVLYLQLPQISAEIPVVGECPRGHNYAYYDGNYCCRHPDEAYRPETDDDPPCLGSWLEIDSRCCKDNDFVPCPHEDGVGCRSIERSTCYLDGEMVAEGVPSEEFEKFCLEQADQVDDDADVWTVTEVFKGEEEGWVIVGGCEMSEDGLTWGCTRNRISAGSDGNAASSVAGVAITLMRAAPQRECSPPRRWIQRRGRFVCRRPRRNRNQTRLSEIEFN